MRAAATLITALTLIAVSAGLTSSDDRRSADPNGLDIGARYQIATSMAAGRSLRPGGTRRGPARDPYQMISQQSLLASLGDLCSIQPFSGWRLATTTGEVEAFDYMQERLRGFGFLASLGLEMDLDHFNTYKAVEFHEIRIHLSVAGQEFEVPADGSPGHRDLLSLAMRFDSDGIVNDSDPDPVIVEGPPIVVRSATQLAGLTPAQVEGRIVLLDYALIDWALMERSDAVARAHGLLEDGPIGVVLVTSYSNSQYVSHGSFAGDLNAFTWVDIEPGIPILNLRIEDLDEYGISGWQELEDVDSLRMTWDEDIHEVGTSSYLAVRIPGIDGTRAVLLGAHIDSPNTPGAFDNGSGSVTLLEIARALDAARLTPPTDLYLLWFGGHEIGMYGSQNFSARNSELIDRSLAMLQMDCLGHPLDGIANYLTLEAWPYGRFGDSRLPWTDYIESIAQPSAAPVEAVEYYGLGSDNGSFGAYNLPNALLIYMNPYDSNEVHYANHLHDPYDELELAELEADVLDDMTRIMMDAALRTGVDNPQLRVIPDPDRRALFVASHTEAAHMSGSAFTEFGMALGWEGFDVDTLPYGEQLTADDLDDVDLVIALPVHDYPSPEGDPELYDESGWLESELDALEGYVRDGGLLVLANSARRLKYVNFAYEENEDWQDQNALAERFDIDFFGAHTNGTEATAVGTHPLVQGVSSLAVVEDNVVRFTAVGDQPLARSGLTTVAASVTVDDGEVIILGDVGILGAGPGEALNLQFWRNLASYAR
jgi:hypothetical protein